MNHTHNTNGNTTPKQNTPVPEGHVTLIGAGPGHPDYITVKGLRVLQQADIIFYDALIHPAFEEYFPLKARSYSVGKRKGAHSYSQEQICELLVQYAQKGLHVVRLKGGDPFIFGRGGEEIIRLQEEGIPYRCYSRDYCCASRWSPE
jgi:siroheme synthase